MKKRVRHSLLLLTIALTTLVAPALNASAESISNATFPKDTNLLWPANVNLTGEKFFKAWRSGEENPERLKADLYLLGALDATEGKVWCDYKTLKIFTVHEVVYRYFQKLPPDRLKERASTLILEAMVKDHSCKKGAK